MSESPTIVDVATADADGYRNGRASVNKELLEALEALVPHAAELWKFYVDNRLDPNDPVESAEREPLAKAGAAIIAAGGSVNP